MWKKKRSRPSREEEISNERIRGGRDDELKIQEEINKEEEKKNVEEEEEELGLGFYACYLLASLSPRHKGHSYIGFTVNPRRRIRQHNGEITSGAWKTKKKRPWEMVLCIYGFPTNVSALQFEWAWQHPTESLSVRSAAATFKSLSGISNKIKLAYTMLTLPTWQGMNLTINFFSTKYTKHSAGCPNLPRHMEVQVCPMDDLPCYAEGNQNVWKNRKENGSDWYEDEERDQSGSRPDENIQEGFTDTTAQYSAINQSGIETTLKEKAGQSEENGVRQTMEQITPRDCKEDHFSADSFLLSSTIPSLVISEETTAGRRIEVQGGLQHGRLPRKPVSSYCSVIASEVEVIDISTPSPDFPSCTKKRRAVHSQIIDLTRSPIFIQL